MTIEIISRSISMRVWERPRIELTTPGSTARLTTDSATGPGIKHIHRLANAFTACKLWT